MSYQYYRIPTIYMLFCFSVITIIFSAQLPPSLLTQISQDQLAGGNIIKIPLLKDKQIPVTVFGWIRFNDACKGKSVNLISLLKSAPPEAKGLNSSLNKSKVPSIMELTVQNNELISVSKTEFVKNLVEKMPFNYRTGNWYFITLTINPAHKTIHFTVTDLNSATDVGYIQGRSALLGWNPDNFNELITALGPKAETESEAIIDARDFSFVYGEIKERQILYSLRPSGANKLIDIIMNFKSLDEARRVINENKIMGDININYQGEGMEMSGNSWIKFKGTSKLFFKNFEINESKSEFMYQRTYYFLLEFSENLSKEFVFFSSFDSEKSEKPNFQITFVDDNHSSSKKISLKFSDLDDQIFETHFSLLPNTVHGIYLTFNLIEKERGAVSVKVGDDFESFSVRLKKRINQTFIRLLPIDSLPFEGTITLFRLLVTDAFNNFLINNIIDLPQTEIPFNQNGCYFGNNLEISTNKSCLVCEENYLLDPSVNQCLQNCPSGRRSEMGICIQCENASCSELNQKKFIQVKRLKNDKYKFMVDLQKIKFDNQINPLAYFQFRAPESPSEILDFTILSKNDKNDGKYTVELLTSNKTFKRVLFEEKPEAPLFDSLGNRLQNVQVMVKASNFRKLTTSNNSASNSPTINDGLISKPILRILALVLLSIFLLGLTVGIVGCIYPLEPSNKSFFFQKFIQSILVYQYICFWSLYGVALPKDLNEFLNYLYDYSINTQQLFADQAKKISVNEVDSTEQTSSSRWKILSSHGMHSTFVNNFAIILFVQAGLVLVILALSFLAKLRKARRTENCASQEHTSKITFSCWIKQNSLKLIFVAFISFSVEISTFSFIQLAQPNFSSLFSIISFIVSILISVILMMHLAILFINSIKRTKETAHISNFGFSLSGLQADWRRCFLPLQCLFYVAFGITIAAPFSHVLYPLIINYSMNTVFAISTFWRYPIQTAFKHEQVCFHILLWTSKTLLFVQQLGAIYGFLSPLIGSILSIASIVFCFSNICWNTISIIVSFISECRLQNSKISKQGIFTFKNIGNESLKLKNEENLTDVQDSGKIDFTETPGVRFSAQYIYECTENDKEKFKQKSQSLRIIDREDDAIMQNKLATLNFPAKLAHLKYCNFPSNENITSIKTHQNANNNIGGSFNKEQFLLANEIKANTQNWHKNAKFADNCNESSRDYIAQGKGSTKDSSHLRPMNEDLTTTMCAKNLNFSLHNNNNTADPKFNQILTQSRLQLLKDSVSFTKKNKNNEIDESSAHNPILQYINESSKIVKRVEVSDLPVFSKLTNYSGFNFVSYTDDDDSKTIRDLQSDIYVNKGTKMLESELCIEEDINESSLLSKIHIKRNKH